MKQQPSPAGLARPPAVGRVFVFDAETTDSKDRVRVAVQAKSRASAVDELMRRGFADPKLVASLSPHDEIPNDAHFFATASVWAERSIPLEQSAIVRRPIRTIASGVVVGLVVFVLLGWAIAVLVGATTL
jgi:hypothetical protein